MNEDESTLGGREGGGEKTDGVKKSRVEEGASGSEKRQTQRRHNWEKPVAEMMYVGLCITSVIVPHSSACGTQAGMHDLHGYFRSALKRDYRFTRADGRTPPQIPLCPADRCTPVFICGPVSSILATCPSSSLGELRAQ